VSEVKVIATKHAQHFFEESGLPPQVKIYRDDDEWEWRKVSLDFRPEQIESHHFSLAHACIVGGARKTRAGLARKGIVVK
jgi:hypothetical protein